MHIYDNILPNYFFKMRKVSK